jgi:hypothetical protein
MGEYHLNSAASFPPLPDGTIARKDDSHPIVEVIEWLQSVVQFQGSGFILRRTEDLGGGFRPVKNRHEVFVIHVDLFSPRRLEIIRRAPVGGCLRRLLNDRAL